jgi:hypothetical protein
MSFEQTSVDFFRNPNIEKNFMDFYSSYSRLTNPSPEQKKSFEIALELYIGYVLKEILTKFAKRKVKFVDQKLEFENILSAISIISPSKVSKQIKYVSREDAHSQTSKLQIPTKTTDKIQIFVQQGAPFDEKVFKQFAQTLNKKITEFELISKKKDVKRGKILFFVFLHSARLDKNLDNNFVDYITKFVDNVCLIPLQMGKEKLPNTPKTFEGKTVIPLNIWDGTIIQPSNKDSFDNIGQILRTVKK